MGGMTRLLLLLWAGVTVGTVVDLQKRILGGHKCLKTERLYHVQVRAYSPDGSTGLCGGSLIGPQWILTAAHCWNKTRTMKAVLGLHPGPGPETEVDVTPHFFVDKQNKKHDIMLLKINTTNTKYNDYVLLPSCPPKLTTIQIAGHINTTVNTTNNIKGSNYSETLLCANTDFADCKQYRNCLKKNPQQWATISHDHWLCYQRARVDDSGGDSGGGLVYNDMIYGVISFGSIYACKEAAASMDVCSYMNWILSITRIPRPKKCSGCAAFVRKAFQSIGNSFKNRPRQG